MPTTLPRRINLITLVTLVVALALAAPSPGEGLPPGAAGDAAGEIPAVPLPKRATIESLNLTFDYPADFAEGRYKHDPDSMEWLHNCALVFVEITDADKEDLERLKPGELPSISVHPLPRSQAQFFMTYVEPEWKCSIGGNIAYKLPCYPFKFGKGLHCYVLPLPDGSAVLFLASRRYSGEDIDIPTRYDWVIERMIASARPARSTIAAAAGHR